MRRSEQTHEQPARAANLLAKHIHTFPAPGTPITGRTETVVHDFDTGSTRPICCNPRKISPKKIKIQQELVDRMLEEGQIEHSVSACSAPTALVTKKDGSTRFCVDYRRLNAHTKKDAFPLPRIYDSLNSLSGQAWFSTLDLASGYWQVRLSENAKPKTAFATHSGLDRPDRVGPHSNMEQSVILRSDVDQVEHISANIVHHGVKMSRRQPVTEGPAGPVRTCRPVGTEWRHAEDAMDRPTAGGPVAKLFNSDPLCPSGIPFLDELYPPIALGPVGQPFITGPLGDDVSEPDCHRRNRSYGSPEGSTGVLDAVYQTGHDVQTDRLRIGSTNGQASSGNIPQSCDSGVHSWNEQWEYMSENSTYGASAQTVGSDCEDLGRVPLIEIRAPPKMEEEEDSDYPWTDGLLSGKFSGCSSQVVYSVDSRIPYSAVTKCGSGRITDIAVLSDFSDDSAETGVRQLSKCRVPVTVQPMLPAEDVIPMPWDQPVDHANRAVSESKGESPCEETLIDGIPSSMYHWDKRVLPGTNDPEFESCALRMMDKALARDVDHRLDKTYPEFIQYMIKSMAIYRNTWDDHDAWLKEQGTICTAPGCQCHVRTLFPLFPEGKETVDSGPAEFTDCNRRTFVMESTDSDSEEEVPGTYTPPLQRKRSRKYA